MKKIYSLLAFLLIGASSYSQCTNASAFGSATAPTSIGQTTTISGCSFQTEYSTVSGLIAGNTYSIAMSSGGCVTVHSGSPSGPVVAFGTAPLSFTPTAGGTYYFHWNTNCGGCGTATNCITTSITMTGGTGPPPPPPCTGGANNSCATADPFCTGTAYNYCNSTGVASAGAFGCLFTTPNPMWMYLNIQTSGSISILMEQFTTAGTPIDVDFAIYGPYTSVGTACPIGPGTPQVDCSYDPAAVETGIIPSAVAGQWYMLLITNFNGQAGYIEFSQNGGTGSTNCNIVNPTCSSTAVGTNPACSGGTGSILVTATGGSPNFNVSWSGTSSGNPGGSEMNAVNGTYNITGLAAGNYNVTVTDNTGCTSTNSVTITVPTVVTATQAHTNPLCSGGTTTATITGAGGTAPYNVSWTGTTSGNPAGNEIAASGGTYNMTGLGVGTYNVTVTSANGCTATVTVTVTTPPVLTATDVETNVTCSGLTNGNGAITATGGTAPYNVSWTGTTSGNPGGNEIAASGGTYNMAGLGAGTYNVTVTDANGCTATTTVNIAAGVTINANISPIAAQCLTGNSFSFSGSTSTISSGSITSYNWNFGAGATPATGSGVNPPAVTYSGAGTMTVTLTVSNGTCTNVETLNITVNAGPTISNTPTNPLCNGATTGSILVTASGATAGYNVSWTGTTTGNPAGTEIAASGGTYNMTGLGAGTYNITVTSANGCTSTMTVNLTNPTVLTATDVETNVLCFGATTGSGLITATGSTAPYNVSWTGTTSGNPAGTEIAASGGTYNMAGLGAGTYNVTVTSANGCTATTTVNITQPASAVTASDVETNVLCNGGTTGSGLITATGGTAPYNVSWTGTTTGNPAGTEIAASGGTYNMTGLGVGVYNVTVTDANLCTATTTVNITQPTATTASDVETNVLCNGATTGSAVITATGGVAGYNVSWTGTTSGNPAGTEIAASGGTYNMTGLGVGVYNVTVTNANGCTATTTVNITQPTALTASDVETNVLCNGGTTGSGLITATGGTAPYNVSWTGTTTGNPAGTEIAASGGTYNMTGLGVGVYNVTVTDANLCTATTTVNITQPTATTASDVETNVLCNGATTGSAVITATGGVAGYNVSWTGTTSGNPAGTEIAASGGTYNMTGLGVGVYNVTVTNANGCTATTTVNITQPTAVTASNTSSNVSCNGGTNGAATITGSGGTAPYNVSWTGTTSGNPAGTEIAASGGTFGMSSLGAGVYNVTVTDANGCTATTTVTITQPTVTTASDIETNVLCNGGTTGNGAITATGGTAPYNVSWTGTTSGNPAGTEIAASGGTYNMTGLGAGTYNVTVTNANGCTATTTVNITQPTVITLTPSSTNTNCGASTGTASVVAAGGAGGYGYVWSPAPGAGQGTAIASGLAAGNYTVTVTDANGCTAVSNIIVGANAAPTLTEVMGSHVNVTCSGGNNGAAVVSAAGGAGGYTYNWVPAPGAGQGTANGTLMTAGTYTVTVTDLGGCTASVNITITQPTVVVASNVPTNVLCNAALTGSAVITATGGVAGYNVSWTGTTSGNPAGTEIAASGGTFNMTTLGAGTYNVTVTDASGCTGTTTVTITQPTALSVSDIETNVLCNGGTNGNGAITATGGTAPYNVSWTGTTTGNPAGTEIAASGGTFNMTTLGAGSYNVTVTDANGCTATTTVNITQPALLTATDIETNVLCNGGTTGNGAITATGGAAPYNISWTGTTTGNPAGNEIAASGGTFNMITLGAGTYNVTVTDANGCTATTTVNITEPTALTASDVETNILCNGATTGNGAITANGGTAPYNVSWTGTTTGNPAGTEIAASGGTFNMTALGAGTYNVTVTDANLCTATTTVTITQPTVLTASDVETNVLCNGGTTGSGTVTATGGTAPYNVSWTGTTTGNPAGTEIATSGGTFSLTTLGVGTYNVTVTDANLCTATTTVNITQPTAINLVPSSTNANCGASNGTASVVASGGAGGYTYSWSPAPGGGQGTATATGITAGSYTVTVTDANLCTANSTIIVGSNLAPTATEVSHVNVLCNGGTNGSILANVTGGAAGYNISWTGPSTGNPAGTEIAVSGGTYNITGLMAGAYTVTATDVNGCTSAFNTTITEPILLTAADIENNVLCFGGNNGSAIISATNGTAPYNVSWTGTTTGNPAGTEIASSGGSFAMPALSAGTYNITVTDASGCTATTTSVITQPTAVTITSATSINALCFGSCNGSVNASATGGTGTLTYTWVSVGTGASQSGLCAGTYNIIVTDANNCAANQVVIVGQPSAVSATTSVVNANCGSANGSATVVPSGGMGGYTYSWTTAPVQTGATATGLIPGVYDVTVTDVNLCSFTTSATVGNNTAGSVNVTTDDNVSCFGAADGQMTATMVGGSPIFSYSWNTTPVQTSSTATGVGPGTYTVTVTDGNGCVVTGSTTVTEPTDLVVSTVATDVSCPGGNDGIVTSNISGGTLAYGISWSNGPTTGNITGLAANTYTITVTDGNGCIETSTATVNQPSPFALNVNTIDINCKDDCTGSADAVLTGGTLPYSYSWNDALTQTTQVASFLCDGTYNVTITDDNGCITNGSATINEPTELVLNTTSNNANCGQADGDACVIASGGAGGYTYLWNTGQTTSCLNNVLAGTYVVDVTDVNGCTETVSITILDLNGPSATIIAQTNVSCFGVSDGTATVDMVGGSGFFTVQWDPTTGNQTTPTASNLPAGTYGVTITDAVGCNASTSVVITEPDDIVYIETETDATCYNYCDGIISVAVVGGTTPYTYSWFDALNTPIGTNSSSVAGLCDGNYNLVLSDANGCTENISYSIIEPVQITGTISSTNVICNGACDGTGTIVPLNGVPPFTFSWNDPDSQTTSVATGLCPGTYDLTLTDDNGCFEVFTTSVTEPPLLTSSITVFGDVSCSGSCDGFAQVDFLGGVGPYQILWSNGSSNQVATNLCTGSYDVTVTDDNGCTSISSIVITTPNPLVLATTQVDLICNNACIGEAQVTATGGTTPYNYQWDNPTFDTDDLIDNQCAGTYTVLVTDDNGCTASSTVTLTEPAALDFTYTSQNSNCMQPNGQICTNVIGGVAPYFYQWDDPFLQTSACAFNITAGCYNLILSDGNGCVKDSLICINDIAGPSINLVNFTDVTCQGANDGSISVNVSGGAGNLTIEWFDGSNTLIPPYTDLTSVTTLNGDTYGVTVSDTAGCLAALSQFIFEPNSVFAAVTATTEPLCFGGCDGTATVSASGGDGNYTYLWNAGSSITAANNTGLCAGPVSVTVSDGNGCSFTTGATITQPTLITGSTNSTSNVTCFGFCNGSVIVSASGATPPYSYNWTLGVSTGPTATNLCPNTYTTVITDAQGCFTALINTITEPGQLAVATSTENSTCTQCNGEATATVSGGTSPFNYQWSSGASLNTPDNTGLCPGAHTINIIDGNGCTISGSATIIDEAGPSITAMNFTQPLCFGLSNGTADVTTTGGTGQIIYSWNDPATQNTQTAFGLIAGNYCVSIQDQNGCPDAQCITVTQPLPLNAIGDLDATICFGDSSQVWASGQGGTAPYTINWSTVGMSGAGPIMVYPAVTTNYCFNVTDDNGCASPNDCVVITVTPPLTMTLTPPSEICDQGSISVVADASGGNGGPYTFTWTDDAGNPVTSTQSGNSSIINVSPTSATWYYVTLSDGCTTPIMDSTQISVNPLPVLFVNVVDPNGCEPFVAQFIVNSDIGVTYDYDFQCDGTIDLANTTNTNPTSTYPLAGLYDVCVTVTSADGCSTTATNLDMVEVYPLPTANFTFTPEQTTILNPLITFTNGSSGGDSIIWDFGDGYILNGTTSMGNVPNGTHDGLTSGTYINPEHSYLDSGLYQITQTIINTTTGCSDVITYELHVEGDYILFTPNSFTPNGDGNNDVFLPQGIGINRDHYKMMIFNRWGELIFETENPELGWDGTYKGLMSQTDVYVWKIQTLDHKTLPHEYIGHVTLLK